MSQPKQRKQIAFPSPFCSVKALNRLMDAHPQWREQPFTLFTLLIQMLISSGDILTDTPRNKVLLAILASLSPVQLTYKVSHHTNQNQQQSLNTIITPMDSTDIFF